MPSLLPLCARIEGNTTFYEQLAQVTSQLTDWADLSTQAEQHGLAPLLYHHLQAANIPVPGPTKRELHALYLRHRHANAVRIAALTEILATFQSAGIETRVLKGAALAHLVYPQPGLRPMRDLDILVKTSEVEQAQRLLADLGFIAPVPAHLPDKHLPTAVRQNEGLCVSVELHHNLFHTAHTASATFEQLTYPPLTFCLSALTCETLGYEEMLWYLCEHAINHAHAWGALRLIWVADVTGFASRFAAQIDWIRVRRDFPLSLKVLSLFHYLTPLPAALQEQVDLKLVPTLHGVGQEFEGWPRSSIVRLRANGKGYRRILADTFYPSEWWLRLNYRLDPTQPLFWHRWFIHPWRILTLVRQLLHERTFNR